MYWSSCLRVYSAWVHRSIELCCHNGRILLKNCIIWLSGANIEAIEVWIERGGCGEGETPPAMANPNPNLNNKTSFLVMKIWLEKTQCFHHWFFVSRIFSFFFFNFFKNISDFPIKISILRVKNVWFSFSREQFGHNLGWFCAIWASQFGQN